jgi:hypothetical protein
MPAHQWFISRLMFTVKFDDHGASTCAFQMPCRFAGGRPGAEDAASRYRP